MKISRNSYYAFLAKPEGVRSLKNDLLLQKIRSFFDQSKSRYGSPRITAVLRKDGLRVGKNRVARIMKINEIAVKVRHKQKYTKSNNMKANTDDLVQRQFKPEVPNRIWGSDITYIRTRQGWKYLSVVMDLCSRMIVGWKVSSSQDENIIINTLQSALHSRKPENDLIFHSDRGSQFKSAGVKKLLKDNNIKQSMGAKATCYDNAVLESFFSTLKKELIYRQKYMDLEELKKSLFEYIEIFYNRQRKHSTLGYLSPFEFESKINFY
ncbi:hypothetical protein BH10BAC5_BH10BAC5_25420 [soil metagenome]